MLRTVYDDDHEAFRKTIRDFIESEVVPVYDDWCTAGIVPREFYNKLGELGVFGIEVAEEYGGAGIESYKFQAVLSEETNRAAVAFGASGAHVTLCLPYLQEAGHVSKDPTPEELEYVRKVVTLEQQRLKVLSEIVELTRFFFEDELEYDEKGRKKWLEQDYVPELLRRLIDRLQGLSEFTHDSIEEAVRQVGEEMGLSGGQVIHPIRMAVTGRTVGPGLFESMAVLGRDRVLRRLQQTLEMLSHTWHETRPIWRASSI